MKIKLILSNGNKHIVEVCSQEEFIKKFTNEEGNITKDILLIRDGLYINPRDIVEMKIIAEIPEHKKFRLNRWLKGWMMVNVFFFLLGFIGAKVKNVLILFMPLELICTVIWFITVVVMFAKHVRRLKTNGVE